LTPASCLPAVPQAEAARLTGANPGGEHSCQPKWKLAAAMMVSLTMHRGDEAVLPAFDLEEQRTPHLAGFAVRLITPDGETHQLLNRLNFATPITQHTTQEERQFHPTNEAPFQKFC
jgi:hypothetical protein